MSSLGLIFLFMLATPQQNAAQHSSHDQARAENQRDRHQLERFPETSMLQDGTYDDHTCFTMRTYYFKRQDGNAPALAGTSTCTPANVLRREQAKRKAPKLVLVPLKAN
ncbi:MAG: hypothetical protein DMG65_06070 [Candidatus Angelobacter sp. Gp1-AA117]|nr:MAG: hypothetical protein DMG65_06070 [Candidatus Angelobacter sp. Gp1-AA117]